MSLVNIMHQSPFGLLFVNYSLLLGIAGGLAICWVLLNWNSAKRHNLTPLILALTLSIGGVLNVLAEVQQQGRLIYGFIYGWEHWYGSIIKFGILGIPALCGLLVLFLLPVKYNKVIDRLLKIAMLLVALFLTMYSGIFMMNEHGIALWNTPLSPLMTMLTGIASGAFVYSLCSDKRENDKIAYYIGFGLTLLALIFSLLLSWWGHLFAGVMLADSFSLLDQHFNGMQWLTLITFIIATVIPIAQCPAKSSRVVTLIASLISGYLLRYLFVAGGEGVSRSQAGFLIFTPDHQEFFYTAASLLFMVGVFALLLLIKDKLTSKFSQLNRGNA
ncbi:hypothetical protein L0B53_00760 [Vibrio sp. SS-MA-C1-2]|uniref:hypothetical protein n=1 Tax=Vibrio sp. SS-MA-C1-2 TaxID=2908646 RepID=UPI001F1CFAAB|nr:hypothetical protein [Vibrio sp. SS-MA-C1-2]UJF17341.1 hypothetical protein L0B53_00760 [Vibrio sp. SS-MA-C1-2]